MSPTHKPVRHDACEAREILNRVGDKWSIYTIAMLRDGPQRFSQLKRAIAGISQRMLTLTLRSLERDGLVTRTVHPTVPPSVEYALTPLGRTLLEPVTALVAWADRNQRRIRQARERFDRR
ncbi:MAG TPA: helix-turn-helix domain-containing protein [Polyangia bacterium]|nr:helix-turn-helix domain-containing protein [Polyangia bacterium]